MTEQRTDQPRKALEVWCAQCAKVCNDSGVPFHVVWQKIMERGIEVRWDQENFKDLFRVILCQVYKDFKSTSDAGTTEYDVIREGLTKWFGQEEGVTLPPWPDRFSQAEEFATKLYGREE